MKLKEIGHLAFTCKDLRESIRFYCDQLGFTHKFSILYGDYPSTDPTDPRRDQPHPAVSTSAAVSFWSCSTQTAPISPACLSPAC